MHPYLIAFLILAAMVAVWLIRRSANSGIHARFVTPAHLAEMLELVAALKQAALEHIEDAGQEAALAHPSCMQTSQEGIRVVYTVLRESGEYVHHFSLQTAGGPTPPPVGEMLMLFIASALGFSEERTAMERSPRGIYHGEIRLTEAEHAAFVERAPTARLYPE